MTQRRHVTGGRCGEGAAGRALGYRRVSTHEQSQSGLGLDAQAEAITRTASRLGLAVTATFDDLGVSGGLPLEDRPGLLTALDGLRRGDTLIVAKRDRLGRSVLNVAMIERLVERKGCRVLSCAGEGTDDDGPTSVLMRSIVDAFAQYERAVIRSRTRAALAALKARGCRAGNLPFGYNVAEDGRTLVPHPEEQRALTRLRDLRAAKLSCRAVATQLNVEGYVTRCGAPWRGQYVWNIASRQVY